MHPAASTVHTYPQMREEAKRGILPDEPPSVDEFMALAKKLEGGADA